MAEKFNVEQIREFWMQNALKHGQSHEASWSDQRAIEMEIREILKRLKNGDRVLDIGCGNGYSTVQFASRKRIQIRGVDYLREMIEQARIRLAHVADSLQGTVEFDVGDIMDLKEPSETYDKVIVIRVIINLSEWPRQLEGLREAARVLKRGGILLLSEATLQGWQRLNRFRREWGLPDIPMPPFNRYLDQEQLTKAVASTLRLVELSNFSSTYYVGTRVLKPLLIKALGADIDAADPHMEWNCWFSQLPSWGDYGTQKLFIFEKV
jgi:ubiquinone/menaquinone biosynthesis C-methylase UbiE